MLLLILSLFFLPTLLAIPFDDCGFESYPIKVTGVELFKEQHKASFNITVSTNKVITGGIVHLQVLFHLVLLCFLFANNFLTQKK
ncbi:unnamed protein product [Brassica oleracea]